MSSTNAAAAIPLPRRWPARIKSGILHAISFADLAITHARGWAADAVNPRARQAADIERLETEVALPREELADNISSRFSQAWIVLRRSGQSRADRVSVSP